MQSTVKKEVAWGRDESFEKSQTEKIISIRQERIKREQDKRARRSKLKMHTCTLFIVVSFALVMGHVIYQNSILNEAKYEIFNLKTEIKSLNAKAEEMQVKIENQTDLNTIEKIATEKLGMRYPSQDQIVYIDAKYHFAATPPEENSRPIVTEDKTTSLTTSMGAFISRLFD